MTKYNLVADVSVFQPDNYGFFKNLKNCGVKAVVIKLTQGSEDGDDYVNPKFATQKQNAERAGLITHAYHYARFTSKNDAVNEAHWFIKNLNRYHVSKSSVAVVDVEDAALPKCDLDADVKAFMNTVKQSGYRKTDLYTMAAWFWSGRMNRNSFRQNVWVARYGNVTEPGVSQVGTWQYTDHFAGNQLDMRYDFDGFYSKAKTIESV